MKYKIWDIVYWIDDWFPRESKIYSNRRLWLFWFYYITRIFNPYISNGIWLWTTDKIYQRKIEKLISTVD